MKRMIGRGVWMTVAALALGVLTTTANAAPPRLRGPFPARPAPPVGAHTFNNFNVSPYNVSPAYTLPTPSIPVNPNYYVSPGLTYRQAAYNQALMNYGTYANTPYANYNPYVTSYNFGPAYGYPSYYGGYGYGGYGYGGYGYGGY